MGKSSLVLSFKKELLFCKKRSKKLLPIKNSLAVGRRPGARPGR